MSLKTPYKRPCKRILSPYKRPWTLQEIQEEGDDACINQICEHGADDGDDEERLDCIAVFIAYSTHVSHRIRSSTKAETTDACAQHRSIIIAA